MTRLVAAFLLLLTSSSHAAMLQDMFPVGEQRCMAFKASDSKSGPTESFELFKLFGPNDVEEIISGSVAEEAKIISRYAGLSLDVQARFRGDRKAYWQGVGCSEDNGEVRCSVDCDGGSFTGKFVDGQFQLKLDNSGFVLQGGCGDEGEVQRSMTNRDAPKGLTLSPRDLAFCEAARAENIKVRLRDSISLRARILNNKWQCLSRTYTADELAKHPKQKVKQLSLAILGAPKRVAEGDDFNTVMQVAITAKLRTGKTVKAQHECFASADSFSCGSSFRLYRRDGETALLKMGEYDPAPGDPPVEAKIGDVTLGADDRLFKLVGAAKKCE